MPNGNGTGPAGAGPMTGRGAGICAGNATAGWQTAASRGMARGMRGGGRGCFRGQGVAPMQMAPQVEIDALRAQLATMEKKLAELGGNKND